MLLEDISIHVRLPVVTGNLVELITRRATLRQDRSGQYYVVYMVFDILHIPPPKFRTSHIIFTGALTTQGSDVGFPN